MTRRPFPALAFAIFALTLASAPTNTKLGGLAWVLLCLMGFWAFLRSERIQQSDIGLQFTANSALSGPSPVEEAARIWLFACLAATAIRIIPHAFWQDDWDRRHAEFRLVLGALATVALVKWPPFYRLTSLQKRSMGDALAMACALGMGVTVLYGRETPLHAIAWAVSLSFLVCLLAPMVLDPLLSPTRRMLWAMGVMMGCMGVVLSQSRGVYGLLIWMALASYVAASNRTLLQMSTFRLRTWLGLALVFGGFIWLLSAQPAWLTSVVHRLSEVWVEASLSQSNPGEAANTSVGSRLFLWSRALDAIEVQPWFGYGKENSIAMIKQWGLEINSVQVQKLGHLHHEFLDAWVSHGLMGILSLLVLATGMGLVVRKLWVPHPRAAQGILGILFMHLTAGL
ncbi:MAG: O-antigen ligase domain-containing protein, partial [Betaproteobacteria bacterium]|nr:O-antigen ligase domain-containing protein [Betaproteobacteria bacterium]